MKKVLVGMLALVMCLGMVSCSKESAAPNLKDVVEKAKAEGANWSVDEWKAAMKDCMLAVKPMMLEMQEIMKGLEGTEGEEADGAKVVEVMAKMAEIQKEYRQSRTVRRATPKVGRNDPCPCGSGRKYKHCCGR